MPLADVGTVVPIADGIVYELTLFVANGERTDRYANVGSRATT
jgi:hypothetical protein